jgi:hypothetical protein
MTNRNERNLFQLFGGLFLIFIFVWIYFYLSKPLNSSDVTNKQHCIDEKIKIYNGVIVDKFQSRGTVYVLSDGSHFSTQCAEKKNRMNVGDSLYKPSNTFDYYIYKKANPDSVVFVKCDFDCDMYDKVE